MTKRKPNLFLLGLVSVLSTLVVIVVVAWLTSPYSNQRYANAHQGCFPNQTNHKVIIKNDKVSPSNTVGSHCDTLTIINEDDTQRMVAFGLHEDHVAYDGIAEKTVSQGQNITITMVQAGSFRFHDHMHDEVQGTFTVTSSR